MDKSNGFALILCSIILGGSVLYGATKISSSIEYAGSNVTNAQFELSNSIHSANNSNGDFEVFLSDGWLYLYNTVNGEIWKKPDNEEGVWERVMQIGE
ncbi:hypothetical protein DCE79_08675 [Lysinibacillus sp. 2017]|uniref:hypothetical protein n=1 Tax=unclassified Lysinibacillus TaxID=2636778 RepID=UPI000D528D6E|nr:MULTISPECIES: hypothetical protein [unclassified Lysinibacillus]AWE07441.1 hypothetical protein DCE79_08675 [Lysinibacillus sp. 2017]TGN36606.1 hypothetical protein E4L99_03390 [Lysinibacillus sp. S2017]